jgi:hypothetical protein
LRLIAFPVFLHALAAPAVARMAGGRMRAALYAAVVLLVAQGAYFQWRFHARPPERWYVFDARFPSKILAPALEASDGEPVCLYDPPGRSGYIQALWHGALRGVEPARFVRLPNTEAPPGSVVISTEESCNNCRLLARSTNFILYAAEPTTLSANPRPLHAEGLRAQLSSRELPASSAVNSKQSFEVVVRNVGGETWPAVADASGRYAVTLRARWLRSDGAPLDDEGPAAGIPFDMEPGDTAGLRLEVEAPGAPGEYVLEVFVVQEGVRPSRACGPEPLRANVRVNPVP